MLQIKKKNAKSAIDPGIESFNSINELCLNLNFIITQSPQYLQKMKPYGTVSELDPVGLTVRYEVMYWVSIGQQWLVLGGTESL